MNISPFLDASLQIQIHAISALESIILGAYMLWATKGSRWHKILGYFWVFNMAIAAGTSFFIVELRMLGPFSFIHILSVWCVYSLFMSVYHARIGNIAAHRGGMRGLYFGGVVVAGVLAFMPGRVLNRMLFAQIGEELGFALIAIISIAGSALYFVRTRRKNSRIRDRRQLSIANQYAGSENQ